MIIVAVQSNLASVNGDIILMGEVAVPDKDAGSEEPCEYHQDRTCTSKTIIEISLTEHAELYQCSV